MNTPPGNPILTTEQMRMADQYTINHMGVPSMDLIELAGQAVAAAGNKLKLDGGRIIIIVGTGNNASDGFVAARILRRKNVAVTIIPLFPIDQLSADASAQANLASQAGAKIRPAMSSDDLPQLESWLKRAVVIIDALLGTGLTRPLTGWLAEAVHFINQSGRPILAVDMPSGICSDTGKVLGTAIKATATLPIAAYKWGHWLQQGKEHCGHMLPPAPIGISTQTIHQMLSDYPTSAVSSIVIDHDAIKAAFPKRDIHSYKQTFGHLWIFGGSQGYTGAPKLSAMGAQAIGTGLVSIACPEDVYPLIASSSLEVMVHPQEAAKLEKAHAIIAGPGWSKAHKAKMAELLEEQLPIVLDADALNILAEKKSLQRILCKREALTVLTPHPGEAGRLLGISSSDIQEDRLNAALGLAEKFNAWVVLKGPQTLIASPCKHIWLNPFGSANLAVAGTGDVLAGMIGGLLSSNNTPEIVIPAAVGLHGLAGEQQGWHRAGQLEDIIASLTEQLQR